MDYVGIREQIGVDKGNVLENLRRKINEHERRISELEKLNKDLIEELREILDEVQKSR